MPARKSAFHGCYRNNSCFSSNEIRLFPYCLLKSIKDTVAKGIIVTLSLFVLRCQSVFVGGILEFFRKFPLTVTPAKAGV